jgi:PelA/Pel-15E family pectate lyase
VRAFGYKAKTELLQMRYRIEPDVARGSVGVIQHHSILRAFAAILLAGAGLAVAVGTRMPAAEYVPWKQCLSQPSTWYRSAEARRIADQVLLYQRENGGWPKNIDMAKPLIEQELAKLAAQKGLNRDSTIDNGATCTQMAFLARVHDASDGPRFKDAFLRGLDFLLNAQYDNGGWPQFPAGSGYHRHITFNDDAMVGVLKLLHAVARTNPPVAFVDASRCLRAAAAVDRGIACILRCQVVAGGRPTSWCAQHDEKTLAPAPARSYELVSLSGSESVGIVRFLMSIERPSPEVVEAIQSAVAWFDRVKLTGLRQTEQRAPSLPNGRDKIIVADPAAPPLWARFYEIDTNRPFFCGRDGVKKYALAEIEHERRTGYAWYTEAPAALLARDYPAWQKRWAPGRNVLAH